MRCEDCKFWDNSTQHGQAEPDTTGICRVLPPTADERDCTARWPFTADTDWCGSFQSNAKDDNPF